MSTRVLQPSREDLLARRARLIQRARMGRDEMEVAAEAGTDPDLLAEAERCAEEIADLLHRTVCDDPPIRALTAGSRVVVAPYNLDGEKLDFPMSIAGEHRLDLRIEFRCNWDFTGKFPAIEQSEFARKVPHLREALIRFDSVHDHRWAPAHVQVHAESSALGFLDVSDNAATKRPPRVQALHIPVGGRRLRPCLEDVIDFAIHDLAEEPKDGAGERIAEGRARWKRLQVDAAIRDVIKNDTETAPQERRETIARAVEGITDDAARKALDVSDNAATGTSRPEFGSGCC